MNQLYYLFALSVFGMVAVARDNCNGRRLLTVVSSKMEFESWCSTECFVVYINIAYDLCWFGSADA